MTLRLEPVTRDDVRPLIGLKVAPEDQTFVAPNAITLAEAPYETGAYVFVIWAGETRVGMIALLDFTEHDYLEEGDDAEAAFIWRLMIADELQGQGYGTAALDLACAWARNRGRPRMFIQAVTTNHGAISLYERCGFVRTGIVSDGEAQLVKALI